MFEGRTQADIARRAGEWVFSYVSEASYEEHRKVRSTVEFLERNKDSFPAGSLSTQPATLAALAIRCYKLLDMAGADSDIVQAIVNVLPEHFQHAGSLNGKRDESG
ncbi:MAG TPA: hypothetical protein VK789_24800 [Bryobacteraceae bacterium]|nr:hypothetical protein [Bryobacteraceae bacterium]